MPDRGKLEGSGDGELDRGDCRSLNRGSNPGSGGGTKPHLYVAADACPVKSEVCKVTARHGLDVTLVAVAWIPVPEDARIRLEVVAQGFDAADDWIGGDDGRGGRVGAAEVSLAGRGPARGGV